MLTLLLTSLLAAAPATGLTVASQLGKGGAPVSTWLDAVEQELLTQLPVKRLTLKCDGDRTCLHAGARDAQLRGLIALSVASGKKQTTLDLEAIRTSDGTTVGQLTFTVTGTRLTPSDKEAIAKLGGRLAAALTEPAKTDTPVVEPPPPPPPVLTTSAPPTKPLDLAQPAPKRSKAPGWILGGAGVAAGIVSASFLIVATGERAEFDRKTQVTESPLTRAEAQDLAKRTNDHYTVSLGTGIAAAALVTAAILWLAAPE